MPDLKEAFTHARRALLFRRPAHSFTRANIASDGFHRANARAPVRSFNSGFELEFGDISTIPQADAIDVRSLTSGKVLGCVHISGTKNTPLEDRIIFKDCWSVGAEHGLVHDGMQADGSIQLRLDWKVLLPPRTSAIQCHDHLVVVLTWCCQHGRPAHALARPTALSLAAGGQAWCWRQH